MKTADPRQRTADNPVCTRQPARSPDEARGDHPRERLQRALGNQAIQALIERGHVYPKLKAGSQNSPQEHEANAVADLISAQDAASTSSSLFSNRSTPDCFPPRTQRAMPASSAVDPQRLPEPVQAALLEPGYPIEADVRRGLEPRLGLDLGNVRVHTGESAARSSEALEASAYTVGSQIVFGADRYAPATPQGRHLLVHELVHVGQQLAASGSTPLAIQRQDHHAAPPPSTPPASPPAFTILPFSFEFNAAETPEGMVLTYRDNRQISLNASAATVPKARAIAYHYVPRTFQREYSIIRLVLAPGVAVRFVGFPAASIPGPFNPVVEVIRVQDPELVPRQGQPIDPTAFTGSSLAQPTDDPQRVAAGIPHEILVNREANGVDISHVKSRITLRVRAPSGAADARFAYQIQLGEEGFLGRNQPTIVTVIKTRPVEVSLIGMTRGQVFTDFQFNVFDVNTIAQVPAQGSALSEQGERVRRFRAEVDETLDQTLAMASVDTGIGLIPVVGDLVDISEFVYGVATGHDRWGRKVGPVDLALMGLGALLPFVSGGLLRGASRVGKAGLEAAARVIGRNADQTSRWLRGLSALTDAELAQLRRWDDLIRRGQSIPAGELEGARRLLAVVGRAVPGEGAASGAGRAIRELLNDAETGFRSAELQEAYRRYLSQAAQQPGVTPLTPLQWARSSSGRTRAMLGAFLGPQSEAVEFATNVSDYVTALRRESSAGSGVGRSWDWSRFGELPPGERWRPGDPINMPDINGNYPDYNGVARPRYWKNRAHFEIQARNAGTAATDAASLDPVRRLSDAELQDHLTSGRAPADPTHAGRVVELEHGGVPQRVVGMISDLGDDFARDARQLAEVSDPRHLMEVNPLEHAFLDVYAHTSHIPGRPPVINPRRADTAGRAWDFTALGDLRPDRPLERMSDGNLLRLIDLARQRGANFNRTAATRQLRDAINGEIQLRGLQVPAFP